jgi:hypothetical protein
MYSCVVFKITSGFCNSYLNWLALLTSKVLITNQLIQKHMGGKDINIPLEYGLDLDHGLSGGMDLDITNIPEIDIDHGLELSGGMNLAITEIPDMKLDMGLDKVDIKSDSKLDMGLDKVNICLNMGIKEMPKMKVHMPTNYDFGLDFFGIKVMNFSLCGKTMIISEDNPTQMFYHPKRKTAQLSREDAVKAPSAAKLKMNRG